MWVWWKNVLAMVLAVMTGIGTLSLHGCEEKDENPNEEAGEAIEEAGGRSGLTRA